MANVGFVHLHVHSSFSLLEGALSIGKLAELAKADKQPALALTDTDNLFGALEFSEKMAGSRHPADRRLPAGGRLRRRARSAAGRRAARLPAPAAHRAARRARGRLPQPDARWPRAPISRARPARRRTSPAARLADHADGPDRADRRARRAARPGARRRARPTSPAARLDRLAGALRRPALCRAAAPRRRGRARGRAGSCSTSPIARGLPLVATNEPFFAKARRLRGARRAALPSPRARLIADGERRRLTPEHYFKTRAEMAALFADLPEALREHRRDRPALRRAGRARGKPILPRFAGGRRRRRTTADAAEAAELRAAGRRGARPRASPRTAWRRASAEEDYRERLDFELGVIEQHEVSRLLPDRRRLHPVGEGAGHSGRARAAARAPARWSPGRSPSPTSIRCASACCSSASSIPSACRCRTSTSTSARTGATR